MSKNVTNNNNTKYFDTHPAAVKIWVENLPLGSTGETSKKIYHALKKVNKQENSLNHHLGFLETVAPTLIALYPRLSKYFTDVSLPLNNKTRNVVHITTALLNEVLKSYQTILKQLISKKSFGWKKPFSLVLHHTFIYTSLILCTHRLIYKPHPKGLWRQLFWCYQQAEQFNLLGKSFNNFTNNHNKTTLIYEFKKLILLSLLSANDLGQKNMREVQVLMPLWIKNTEILSEEAEDKQTCFTLNLLSDAPPYLLGTRHDTSKQKLDRHYLSTSKLKNLLLSYFNKIENDGAIKIGKNLLSKFTVQSLLTSWSRNNLRTENRKKGTGFVDIITGITAIHFVLTQQEQPAYNEVSSSIPDNTIDFESTLTIEPLSDTTKNDTLKLDHFLSTSEQEEDVWGKVYENNFNSEITPAHWTESGIHQIYNFTKSILLDYCKDGYRLSVNAGQVDSLKHNELIAVREHALAPWELAQVKWLHFSEIGDVQIGLRILTHQVLPVHVRYQANNTLSKPLPCLLGLDRKKLMLFVPTLPTNLSGKKLELDHQDQHSHIHLKNKILSTPAFDIYEIYESRTKEKKIATITESKITDNIWESF